ncbi:MAG TPA: LicD family protein [Nocardioides sp.]|nr:LicD family protein [Nocardioides sp.]
MTQVRADDHGLWLPVGTTGDGAVSFDGRTIWRFDAEQDADGKGLVPWPMMLRRWLNGVSHLVVTVDDRPHDLGEFRMGPSTERMSFVDRHGIAIVVDKWGLAQRPFSARGEEVVTFLAGEVLRMAETVEAACGVRLWMAFGTLLGAMRSGTAIPHDSDIDLAYLSDRETPAEMITELLTVQRALSAAGYKVIPKTGSFVTVVVTAPDGAPVTVDVYTCFHAFGKFFATATLRTELPREAIVPLRTLPFAGHELPAPADPDRVLAASYGARWRTPDPGFRHEPTTDVVNRFEGWFGNFMRQRRDWEAYWRRHRRALDPDGSDFLDWVLPQLPPGGTVLDVAAGRAIETWALAQAGHRVWWLDYARDAWLLVKRQTAEKGLEDRVTIELVNFYDLRDSITAAALVARRAPRPRTAFAQHALDAMPPPARSNLWPFLRTVLRGGGRMYAEFDEVEDPEDEDFNRFYHRGGRLFPVTFDELEEEWLAAGATEVFRQLVPVPSGRTRWRIVLTWS